MTLFYSTTALDASTKLPIFIESTPFYLASRQGCSRIIHDIPTIKLIILLREPISRAYSEYNMKLRRVQKQNNFIKLMQRYAYEVYVCMCQLHPSDSADHLRQCVPQTLVSHEHWGKFLLAYKTHLVHYNILYNRSRRASSVTFGTYLASKCYHSSNNSDSSMNMSSSVAVGLTDRRYKRSSFSQNMLIKDNSNNNVFNVSSSSSLGSISSLEFRAISCLGRHGAEAVKGVREALLGEAEELRACMRLDQLQTGNTIVFVYLYLNSLYYDNTCLCRSLAAVVVGGAR